MAVYFFRDESTGAVKIGYARDVERRRRSLQVGLPGEITTLHAIEGDRAAEGWLHARFAHLHLRGEWFRYSDEMLSISAHEIPACFSNIHQIRNLLGLTQAAFAEAIGVTQGNVSHYEQGRQEVSPGVARRIIAACAQRGITVTFDDIYTVGQTRESA